MKQKIINNKDHFKSSDLALVTALSLAFSVEAIDREPTGKAHFVFKRGEDFDIAVRQYWAREMRIEPQEFFNQLKSIKARIYSED